MSSPVLIEGFRTPFTKAGTDLKDLHVSQLGQVVFRELIDRKNISQVDEVIVGNVGNPSDTANIARVIAVQSGLPESISAFTVSRNCASGMESITSASSHIQSGAYPTALVGGAESMSNYPLLFSEGFRHVLNEVFQSRKPFQKLKALTKMKLSYLKPRLAILEGLTDPFVGLNMGGTAEVLAKEFHISRERQDQFALESHQKTLQAQKENKFQDEIVPVLSLKKMVDQDVGPRKDQSLEKLKKLKPYFDRKYGSVTVGNACPITDGACALYMTSQSYAQEHQLKPQVAIRSFAYSGCNPSRMGLGPVFATAKALKKASLSLKDIGLIEINEAFAAQVLACIQAFESQKFAQEKLGQDKALGEIDSQKLNVNGGAISMGHPVGATGTRLIITLMKEMKRRKVQFGLATLCIGGGQGGAVILENLS